MGGNYEEIRNDIPQPYYEHIIVQQGDPPDNIIVRLQGDGDPMEVEQEPRANKRGIDDGGDERPVSKRRIRGGSKRIKSKHRKSKKRKSKRKKTYRKKKSKRNKIGGFDLPPGYENCEGCKCIRKIDNDEIFPDPGMGPPPFPDMQGIRINNNNNDNNIYYDNNNNNKPDDNNKPPLKSSMKPREKKRRKRI
jgi:hypothetical protein